MKHAIVDARTGQITYVDILDNTNIDDLRQQKITELYNLYNLALDNGFTSSATGTPIQYIYNETHQMIYSKWANVLSLDSTKNSIVFGISSGAITMTRAQFIQFMNDAEQFELNLFNNRNNLETQIKNATTVDALNLIQISF